MFIEKLSVTLKQNYKSPQNSQSVEPSLNIPYGLCGRKATLNSEEKRREREREREKKKKKNLRRSGD